MKAYAAVMDGETEVSDRGECEISLVPSVDGLKLYLLTSVDMTITKRVMSPDIVYFAHDVGAKYFGRVGYDNASPLWEGDTLHLTPYRLTA